MKRKISFILSFILILIAMGIPARADGMSVEIQGIGLEGEVLTAAVSGAVEGADITYQWYYGPGASLSDSRINPIDGATDRQWTVNIGECTAVSYLTGKFADYPIWVKAECGGESAYARAFIAPGRNDGAVFGAVTETDSANVFAVGGKEFILLDSENGESFILAKDDYGTHNFDAKNSQRYSTERETNIGFWLNSSFLNGGNDGSMLPDEIMAYLKEHEWVTNNIVADAENGIETTYNTAKLALMSIEEFNRYSGRFGIVDSMPYRWWLRSSSNGTQALCADIVKAAAGTVGFTTRYDLASKLAVRPVFYLDNEFFANIKIDAYMAGENVKSVIRDEYPDYANLKNAGYSDEELAELGYEIQTPEYDFGELESVTIHGVRAEGEEWTAVWDSADIPESMLEFQWYYGPASIADKRTKAIPNANSKTYIPSIDELTALNGVYNDWPIWLRVRLKSNGTTIDVQTSLPPARNYTGIEGAARTTPTEYVFTVDGQDFILLDTDESGFLVLAKDAYGSMSFDTSKTNSKLDPSSATNIGSWLNGEFLESGSGGKMLPQAIKDSLVTANYKTTRLNNGIEEYNITAKIALLSLEEYNRYAYKIGAAEMGGAWWLRTATNSTQVLALTTNADTGLTDRRNVELTSSVRPLFRIDRSFFTKQRVGMGEEVMKLLGTAYSYDELKGIYTEHELIDKFGVPRSYRIIDCRRENGSIIVDFENLTENTGSPVVILQPTDGGKISASSSPAEAGQRGTIIIPTGDGEVEISIWDSLYDMNILHGGIII